MDFNERLREYRKRQGISAKDFAARLGLAYTTYISYENTNKRPTMENLPKIAAALHVSVDELLGVSGGEAITNQNRLDYWQRYLQARGYTLSVNHALMAVSIWKKGTPPKEYLTTGINIDEFLTMMERYARIADELLEDTRAAIIMLQLKKALADKKLQEQSPSK